MRDLWGFLIQTLTASGAAALLLLLKAIFRDKLSPRWQFGIWGLLGLVLLVPAGLTGHYALLNWPLWVEAAKTLLTDAYTLSRVIAPIPLLPAALPGTVWDWLYLVYLAGVVAALLRQLVSHLRLRAVLRTGAPADDSTARQISDVAAQYGLPRCRAIRVSGLTSAFLCGVIRPTLVLPAETEIDDKVLLHELLHLRYRDTVWNVVICLFQCIHWCNPLLRYCAGRASNDLEARCDQRVLERLDGEDRREYGHILLSMANETYANTAGTTSAANGGKNIRRRIEAIARFKLYPAGMALVSVCMAVLLIVPLTVGTRTTTVRSIAGDSGSNTGELALAFASARTTPCTTPAGALDAYGKALLTGNGIYRAMCAPLSMQEKLRAELEEDLDRGDPPLWDTGFTTLPDTSAGYQVYNLIEVEGGYEGLMAVQTQDPRVENSSKICLALQTVRVEQEGSRWVVLPLSDFDQVITDGYTVMDTPCQVYSGEAGDVQVTVYHRTRFEVDNTVETESQSYWFFGPTTYFDTVPKPNAEFSVIHWTYEVYLTWLGSEEGKDAVYALGISVAPVSDSEESPSLRDPGLGNTSVSSSDGTARACKVMVRGWGPTILMVGSGSDVDSDDSMAPDYYAADLYLNGQLAAELELRPTEGGTP